MSNTDDYDIEADSTAQTDAAKSLIAAVVRAFYDDSAVVIVDFLLDAKFLRDGNGMGTALNLKTKQVRETLNFLQREHLVDIQCVEGRVETQDKNRTYRRTERANFWYLDLNKAVTTIALRLRLIKEKLQDDINKALSTSTYQCPGYLNKACNGIFTEMEVQHCPVDQKHNFLCQECHQVHQNNPNPPHSYVLKLVDNSKARMDAEEKLRRFETQMTGKIQGDQTVRPGIYDLLQKVEKITERLGLPVTSNLPSENGAKNVLIGNVLYDTTNFNQEAAEEFSNSIFVRGNDGQRLVLDLELGTGLQANFWAKEGASPPAHIADASKTNVPKPQTNRTASLEAIAPIPKPKRLCRNTTPYFLKEYKRNVSPDEPQAASEDLAGPFRQMSIDMKQLDQDAADADAPIQIGGMFESTNSSSLKSINLPAKDTCILWQTIQQKPDRASVQQFVQQVLNTQKTHRRSSSFPPQNIQPACTFNSIDASSVFDNVDWQSADSGRTNDNNNNGNSIRNETRASVAERWGNMEQFKSMDMFENILPSLEKADMGSRDFSLASLGSLPAQGLSSLGSLPPHNGKPYIAARDHSLASLRSSIRDSTSSIGMLESFRLQSMDAFAMQMGTFNSADAMNMPQNNKNAQPRVNNNSNTVSKASLDRLTSTDRANLDSLQLFRTKDFWENAFATKDMTDLNLSWQHPQAQPKDDKCIKPDYLASKDWISHDWLVNMNSADINAFQQSDDRKPSAKPKPTSKWEKMYQEGLNPSPAIFPSLPDTMPHPSGNPDQTAAPAHPKSTVKKKGSRRTEPEVKVFVEFTDLDVLCQRGTKSRLHPGSQRYRALVEHLKPEYHAIPKKDKFLKTKFAEDLVKQVQAYGGRFLEKDKETGQWYIIADALARRKAGQALRDDNTPEARKAKREKYSKKDGDDDNDDDDDGEDD